MSVSDTATGYRSNYLKFLPGIYQDDEVMGRFLMIFESIMSPIERTIDNIAAYFDPQMVPPHLLDWLASWLDLTLDPTWPEARRRELVKSAAELYRWRGTRRGLAAYLKIYTGMEPEIHEYTESMPLGSDTKLGSGTVLGSGVAWHHFIVVVSVDKYDRIVQSNIRSIVESQKPAHSTYTLRFTSRDME